MGRAIHDSPDRTHEQLDRPPASNPHGYPVTYRKFTGGHEVPRGIRAKAAQRWFLVAG